jgi:DHA1 family tetracycline resistance protein-like MFS transporter
MSPKKIDPRLATILLIVFVQIVGAGMALPILPLFARRQFAMSDPVITLLVASFFAAQFVAGPFLGRWSDRAGRLPVLIISQIGTAISFVMLALAPNVATLFAARILDGITGGNIIVAQAYVTDITPKEKRTQALGLIFAAFGVGFIVGPATGGLLSAAFGERMPFIIAAIAAALTVLLTWRTLDETVTPEQQASSRARPKAKIELSRLRGMGSLVLVLVIAFVAQFGFGMLQSTFARFGEEVIFFGDDPGRIALYVGLLLAVIGLSQLLTQTLVLGRLVRRLGDAKLVVLGGIARTLGMGLFAAYSVLWQAIAGSALFAFGMGTSMPALQSLATRAVDDEERGAALGMFQSVVNLAVIFSTAGAGLLFAYNPRLPYAVGTVLSLAVVFLALVLVARPLPGSPRAAAEAEPDETGPDETSE